MLNKFELKNTDSHLRLKLLLGQIILAVLISAIYVVVAYRLASDIGKRIEIDTNEQLLIQLSNELTLHSHGDDIESTLEFYYKNAFANNQTVIKVCAQEDCIIWNNRIQDLSPNALLKALPKGEQSGIIKVQNMSYVWATSETEKLDNATSPSNSDYQVTLIRKTNIFDTSLEYVATRLSITSFITFWVAVWTALIITTISLSRIAKSNTKLRHIARHDALTGLPNRAYLMEKLDAINQQSPNDSNKKTLPSVHLLLIDLNKFKDVNDSMGHDVGDELLRSIATRLKTILGEKITIYRYGGDEFVALITDSLDTMANRIAQRLIAECNTPIPIDGQQFSVGASIGIARYPQDAQSPTDLLKCADIAMYQAKKMRIDIVNYQFDQKSVELLRIKLREQIKGALADNRFILHYQPKVHLPHGEFSGVEALVRWDHPEAGLLNPGMFIDLVEDTGLVHEFCHYVIIKALEQIKLWQAQGISLSVAVNISPYNVLDQGLEKLIVDKLNELSIDPALLELELTESASMIEVETISRVFSDLKKIGIKLSIDDFGTGMSSLAYIKNIGVDTIKIDRSFVTNIDKDKKDQIIISNIISLCHDLGYQVVAEGIETKEQLEKLIELKCSYAQGYYFSRPVDPDTLAETYRTSSHLH